MHDFRSDLIKTLEDAYRYARQKFYFMVGKGILNNIGGSGIEFLADEVAQEVCIVVFLRYLFDALKGIDNFKYWVYGIARHKTFDIIEKFVIRPENLSRAYENILQLGYDQLYSETNPENLFAAKEKILIIERMINDLNPRQKLILRAYLEGVPNWEIAGLAKASCDNINVTICNLKKKLNRMIQQYIV